MTKTTATLILAAIACAGCYADPCTLKVNMTPEELAECEAEAMGETGFDPGPLVDEVAAPKASPDNFMQFGTYTSTTDIEFSELTHDIGATSMCASTGAPYPHVSGWGEAVHGVWSGRLDTWCPLEGDHGAANADLTADAKWSLCRDGDRYRPATEGPGLDFKWNETATCGDGPNTPAPLPPGNLIAVGGTKADTPLTWTYQCDVDGEDDYCTMPGGACEGGYWLDGFYPRPTLCKWDTQSGEPLDPGGPSAYHLDSWEDGITIRPGSWEVTSFMFDQATFKTAGLWNDDQRYDLLEIGAGPTIIEVTRCGDASLCTHVGLAVGDRLSFPDADPRVAPVLVTIEHIGGDLESILLEVASGER